MAHRCPICRHRHATWRGVVHHARDKHQKTLDRKPTRPTRADDGEESYADRAIQAEQDHAAGIPNPDIEWLTPHLQERT